MTSNAVFFFLMTLSSSVVVNLAEDHSSAYCFRLTWIGPKTVDMKTFSDLTCDDFTNGYEGVPCRRPLVATGDLIEPDNQLPPNMSHLWITNGDNNTNQIACKLNKNDVCLKHVYRYNNKVENITYMCGKLTIEEKGSAPLGCYKQKYPNGRELEVCSCESSIGYEPCNSSSSFLPPSFILLMLSFLMLKKLLINYCQ
ncbi:hypothetical protein ACFFRR_009388 [Megaselia abdita]